MKLYAGMNFTTRAWMLHLHERRLPINLLLVGKWKDLQEATSLQRICTCHLVDFLWPLNVLYPPQEYGSCTSVRSSILCRRLYECSKDSHGARDGLDSREKHTGDGLVPH